MRLLSTERLFVFSHLTQTVESEKVYNINEFITQTTKLFRLPPKKCLLTRGRFHQRVYAQLLRSQISKVPKRQSTQAAFCAFGICERESCVQKC